MNRPILILLLTIALWAPVMGHANAASSQVERICNVCGEPITEAYFETGGAYYHPHHFTCHHCEEPIKGTYTVYRNQNYHTTCFEDQIALRCTVCSGIVRGQYLLDYWGNAIHPQHRGNVVQCDFCQRFIVGSLADEMVRYQDSRFLCGKCAPSAVTDIDDAGELMIRVAKDLRRIGLEVDHQSIDLRLVWRDELQNLSSDRSHDMKGFTDYLVKKNLFGRVRQRTTKVFLLRGMPRTQMISTIAHELTHVWQFTNGPLDQDKAVSEGSCNYAAYLVLRNMGDPECEFIIENMLKDDDPIYGEGFRRVKAYAEEKGKNKWFALLTSKQRSLPTN